MTFQPKFADLVRVTTTSTGTGAIDLGTAVAGYAHFTDALSVGDQFYYCIQGVDKPAEREVGRGTLQAGAKMAREAISGALTNFTTGSKTVALVSAAEWYARIDAASASGSVAPVILTDQAQIVADFASASNFTVTIGGNRTLGVPAGATAGQSGRIRIVQDQTGGRTINFAQCWLFAGGVPVMPSGPGASLTLEYYVHDAGAIEVESNAAPAPAPVTIASPANQSVLTAGTAVTIVTANPGTVYADGASIGSSAGNPATLQWTPTADPDINLTSNASSSKMGAYPADGSDLTNPAKWVSGDGTMAKITGAPDPWGGTTGIKFIANNSASSRAYKCEAYAVSAPTATANAGIEFWFSPEGTAFPTLRVNPYEGTYNPTAIIKHAGKQVTQRALSGHKVETKVSGGRTWYRYLFRGEVGTNIGNVIYFVFGFSMDVISTQQQVVNSGTHGGIFAGVRYIDGVAPLYKWQRAGFNRDSALVGSTTALRYQWGGPFNDGDPVYDGGSPYNFDVLLPDSYNPNRATPYNVVVLLPVEQDPNAYNGEITGNGINNGATYANQGVYHQNLHNTLDTIFVRPTVHDWSYGGVHASGIRDHKTFFGEAVPKFLRAEFNVGKIALMGYSKAAMAALYLLQMYPDTFDCAGLHDGPFGKTYGAPDYGEAQCFGTKAQYDAYEPLVNLAARAAPLKTRRRLTLSAGTIFGTNTDNLRAALNANGISFVDRGTVGPVHDYLAAWGNVLARDLVQMMNGMLA